MQIKIINYLNEFIIFFQFLLLFNCENIKNLNFQINQLFNSIKKMNNSSSQ
jgi:hypothetical protein